jgi:hypothetical protein
MEKPNEIKYKITKKNSKIIKDMVLDNWLSPLVEKFSFIPEMKFSRYLFGLFNNQDIFYYAINGEMCFTLEEFAKYMDQSYDNVKRAFNRLSKKYFSESKEPILKENIDFIKMARNECYSRDKLSLKNKGKDAIFLTFLGIWKLLPTFRDDLPIKLYYWFGEKLYAELKDNTNSPSRSTINIYNCSIEEVKIEDTKNIEDIINFYEDEMDSNDNDRDDRIARQFG